MRDDPGEKEQAAVPPPPGRGDPEVRAKYIEYCSARISEVFLSLTDEQTYRLLEEAAREEGADLAALGFQSKMRLVTRRLRDSVPLPEFEEWAAEYRAHPERFEPLLLGLWKEALDGQDETEPAAGPGPPEEAEDA
ncbi:MAG: hypothetical protein RRA92_03805 [Gemmatimonadota bacterium]|nr:hypothetical protein [Gemmatimonadota bacterium]